MKKNRRLFMLAAIAAAFALALSACASTGDVKEPAPGPGAETPGEETPGETPGGETPGEETPGEETPDPAPVLSGGYEGTSGGVSFTLPDLGVVSVHTELQASYLKAKAYAQVYKYADGINAGEGEDHRELSHPLPVSFTWEAAGADVSEYTLSVSENEDMSDPWTYTTAECAMDVYNLKIGTTYYWTVAADGTESGKAFFTTEGTGPRNLYVDGVANVRDVGGYVTESGVRVRQGLLYRSGRYNENYGGKVTITEKGKATLLGELGVKTEIDLRGGANDPSESLHGETALGGAVTYLHVGMNWAGNIYQLNPDEIRTIFAVLSDRQSYPIVFHCSIGTDRTGLIAYLVNSLLGVPEESLYRDYLFSNFAYIEGTRDLSGILKAGTGYVSTIKGFEGKTLSEKTANALKAVGVTQEELDEIVKIFTA